MAKLDNHIQLTWDTVTNPTGHRHSHRLAALISLSNFAHLSKFALRCQAVTVTVSRRFGDNVMTMSHVS